MNNEQGAKEQMNKECRMTNRLCFENSSEPPAVSFEPLASITVVQF
jgi:hypothetical protein